MVTKIPLFTKSPTSDLFSRATLWDTVIAATFLGWKNRAVLLANSVTYIVYHRACKIYCLSCPRHTFVGPGT